MGLKTLSISPQLEYAQLSELFLDPKNPRLGRHYSDGDLSQQQVLELMEDWTLDELAQSFLESGGFWIQEALIVVNEELYGEKHLVVIEGNRRLAALICLDNAFRKNIPLNSKFAEMAKASKLPKDLFNKIPYLLAKSRTDVDAFLGFRHVTGIKEWKPAEKAQFITKLIDSGFTYEDVRKKIGSKTPTVRTNYIAYRLLLQIEDSVQTIPEENFENRFSVLYLTLGKVGTQKYLNIDIAADPKTAKKPVPQKYLKQLKNFATWLFGDQKREPLFSDSRDATKFSNVLMNKDAVKYLESAPNPIFEQAVRISGADEEEIIDLIRNAAYNVEYALSRAHLFKKSKDVKNAVELLSKHTEQLKTVIGIDK